MACEPPLLDFELSDCSQPGCRHVVHYACWSLYNTHFGVAIDKDRVLCPDHANEEAERLKEAALGGPVGGVIQRQTIRFDASGCVLPLRHAADGSERKALELSESKPFDASELNDALSVLGAFLEDDMFGITHSTSRVHAWWSFSATVAVRHASAPFRHWTHWHTKLGLMKKQLPVCRCLLLLPVVAACCCCPLLLPDVPAVVPAHCRTLCYHCHVSSSL